MDALTVYANKTASEGILSTINFAARFGGPTDDTLRIHVADYFGLPVWRLQAPLVT
jgi:hypothetical protein